MYVVASESASCAQGWKVLGMVGGRDRDTCYKLRSGSDEEEKEPSWLPILAPKFPSLRFPNPAIVLSSLIQTVTSNLRLLAVHKTLKKTDSGFCCLSSFREEDHHHKPIVAALPVPYLALSSLIFPGSLSVSSKPRDDPPPAAKKGGDDGIVANEKGEVASTGPAFIGQVYTMCDASRRGLIAVRPADVLKKIKMPPYMKFMEQAYERAMNLLLLDGMEGPVFRFYFNRDDAAEYVRRLNVSGSTVGVCSLDAAYKYYKSKQDGTFKFMADHRQVKIARDLVRRERGDNAAKGLKGVPVFTARNLTIAMSTPRGVRWFRPYFFNKKQLDNLINHSVDHYYELLINARRAQRHSQVAENSRGDSFSGGESMEDDQLQDGLMDPPEVQELMEELGQGGGGGVMEFVGSFKALEAEVMDLADRLLLGNQWSRRMILHVEPRFPVIVDSFERLVSPSEVDGSGRRSDEGTSNSSGTDPGSTTKSDSKPTMKGAKSSSKSPYSLFGKKWGVNANFLFRRKGSGDASGELESKDSDPDYLDSEGAQEYPTFQPKLTMVGIADVNNKGEGSGLQQAMASAAKDVEDRARKGEGAGPELGPLFIANLGAK